MSEKEAPNNGPCAICGVGPDLHGHPTSHEYSVRQIVSEKEAPAQGERSLRQRIYAWMSKPHYVIRARAKELGLLEKGDDEVRGDEILPLWMKRAKAKNLVDALINDGEVTAVPS